MSSLYICFGEKEIRSALLDKSELGLGCSSSYEKTSPISSLCVLENDSIKYYYGFDISECVEFIKCYSKLSSFSDYLNYPIFVDGTKSGNRASLPNRKYPMCDYLRDMREKYNRWSETTIESIILCVSLDNYIKYSMILEEIAKESGFGSVTVIDESSLLCYYSFVKSSKKKLNMICMSIAMDSSYVCSFVRSEKESSRVLWKECNYSGTQVAFRIQEAISKESGMSEDECIRWILHSLPAFQTTSLLPIPKSETMLCYSAVKSAYEADFTALRQVIEACCADRSWARVDVDCILLYGDGANPCLLSLLRTLFPAGSVFYVAFLPLYLGMASRAFFLSKLQRHCAENSVTYEGERVHGVLCGAGRKMLSNAEVLYEGYFQNNLYEGFGEEFANGSLLYKGEFHGGKRDGMGVLYLEDGTILKGLFKEGELKDGKYCCFDEEGKKSFEGDYKRGKRNGIGVEYDKEGREVYNGCFVEGERCGLGCFYDNDGNKYEGSFERNGMEGEICIYNKANHLICKCIYHANERSGKGVEYNEEGCICYEGNMNKDGYYGHGICYYHGKGIQYEGEFLNGLFDGYGQYYSEEGDLMYIGEFHQGKRDGDGKEYSSNTKLLFSGKYKKGHRVYGKLFFAKGDYYEGMFNERDEIEGKGKMIWRDGKVYDGLFVKGKKEGEGTFFWNDGSSYHGEWREDRREGRGVMYNRFNDKDYEGEWRDDAPNGKGIIYYSNGIYYEGDVKEGYREGKGSLCNADKSIEYEGEWKQDQPHGYGKYYYGNGAYYEGQWVKGEKDGTGRLQYGNGTYYLGGFKDGMRHGKGCILTNYGKILKEGVYANNKQID